MAKKSAKFVAVGMAAIVAATLDASKGFIYVSEKEYAPLVADGLVEVNPTMANEAGELATRATQKGIDSVNKAEDNQGSAPVTAEVGNTEKVKTMFQIEDNIPVPAISGRGRTGTTYPFDQLEVGQSFFVANTEEKPNAAKSLASTVSSATARYAEPTGNTKMNKKGEEVPEMRETRKFIVRSVEGGARVWRTA